MQLVEFCFLCILSQFYDKNLVLAWCVWRSFVKNFTELVLFLREGKETNPTKYRLVRVQVFGSTLVSWKIHTTYSNVTISERFNFLLVKLAVALDAIINMNISES